MTALESFTSGQPRTVDFTAIERELAGLWKEASIPREGGAGPAVMRACHLNLVVLCDGAEQAARAATTIDNVVRSHPARVLVAVIEPAGPPRLEAFLSAHCAYTPGAGRGKQVCCEQITIAAGGASAARLPGALLPLLLPDLPVALWWPGDPDLSGETARRLTAASDRIVVDSRRFADPRSRYGPLAALGVPVVDLAWHRLRPWRELTAGMFDARPFGEYIARLDTIEIERTEGAGGEAEALLLGCWAASRLRWRAREAPSGPPGARREFTLSRHGDAPGHLIVRAHSGGQAAGRILSLELRTAGAAFSLRGAGDSECVTVSVQVPEACPLSRVARVVVRDDATLLCRALETSLHDALYDETLRLAARLLGWDDSSGAEGRA